MKKLFSAIYLTGALMLCNAQVTDPMITSWKINTTGHTINGILTDVEAVYYDNSYVYVKSSGVPSYYDFNNGNVNDASDKNYTFKLTRSPQMAGTPPSNLNGGPCGVLIDGTTFFNPEDARSYQNANVWHQIAYYFEGSDFDTTWGHSTPTNEYHHHVIDLAITDKSDSTHHSPLLGYAFDGFPIYGPYGYSDANDTNSTVVRLTPSYQKRNITQRTTLPNGTVLQANQYGPAINNQYPLGVYREDWEYVASSGMLDDHNGRFSKTPEYPNGTYAYYSTVDDTLGPRYPMYVGQTFYGIITPGNMGPNGGQNTVPGSATQYTPISGLAEETIGPLNFYPNPTANTVTFTLPEGSTAGNILIYDLNGAVVFNSSAVNSIDVSFLAKGVYVISVSDKDTNSKWISRFTKIQ
ncbi:MAG: YHYH protein [Chitinophagales bacterium]